MCGIWKSGKELFFFESFRNIKGISWNGFVRYNAFGVIEIFRGMFRSEVVVSKVRRGFVRGVDFF
jgi:hypothetical protein